MAKSLPKVRRVGGGARTLTVTLAVVAALLLGFIAYIFLDGSLFDVAPKTDIERDYQLLADAAEKDPENPAVLMTLAETLYKMGEEEQAFSRADEAVEFGPDVAGLRLRYATMLAQSGELDRATAQLIAEIDIAGNANAEPYFLLAQIQVQQDLYEEAIASMEKGLAVTPEAADMRIIYATMLEDSGDTEGAIREYQDARRFLPDDETIVTALERLGVEVQPVDVEDPHGDGTTVEEEK